MATAFPTLSALWARVALPRGWRPRPALSFRILERKLALMYARLPAGITIGLTVSSVIAFVLPSPGGRGVLLLWGLANLVLAGLRLADSLAFARESGDRRVHRHRWRLVLAAAAQGSLWGLLAWCWFPAAPSDQLFLTLIMTGMAGGGIIFLSPLHLAYVGYVIPLLLPACVRLIAGGTVMQQTAGWLGIVYTLAMVFASAKMCRWMGEALESSYENEALVGRLQAANADLEEHKARLEQVVEERTQSLSSAVAQLQGALAFNDQIISSAREGIVVYGPDGRLKLWNNFMAAMTGVPAEAVLGRFTGEVFGFAMEVGISEGVWKALQGESVATPAFQWSHAATGRSGWATAVQAPMKGSDGSIIGVVETVFDLTEWKRVEAHQHQLEAELHHSQKLESLGSLAGGVAHDMNNILGAVQAIVQTLKQKHAGQAGLLAELEILERASTRGRDLVKGLTNFVRKGLEEPELLDLNQLVREEAELLGRTTLQKVSLRVELQESLPAVLGERGALGGALMNLCVNAMDAMPDQGTLTLRTRSLPDGRVELALEDTGKGMPPEVLARAMEPFFTTKAIGKGTGLGLAMVYATVKAHGGSVSLQSEVGRGTAVLVRLPAAAEPAPALAAPVRAARAGALRILQVDDDELILASIPLLLELQGHTVDIAGGGQEALDRLDGGLEVDLVLLDLNMPGMNGLETLSRLRERRPGLPVLLATGYLDPGTEAQLKLFGKTLSIAKPFSMEDLDQALRKIALL